jgi:hypothetical protein
VALHPTAQGRRASYRELVIPLLITAAVIVVMLALTAIFGVQVSGPSLEIVPDPAGLALPF